MTTRQYITKSGDTFEWEETPEVVAAVKKLHETITNNKQTMPVEITELPQIVKFICLQMLNLIRRFFAPSEKIDLEDGNVFVFANKILELQERVEKLEVENVELTNALYECENRMEAKIDSIHPVIYNISERNNALQNYSLGDK